jgi:hypothetical protein
VYYSPKPVAFKRRFNLDRFGRRRENFKQKSHRQLPVARRVEKE